MKPARHAVFSMACSYEKKDLSLFLESLRHSGYQGDIILGSASNDSATLAFFEKLKVQTFAEPCIEQIEAKARAVDADSYVQQGLWDWKHKTSLNSSIFPGINQRRHFHYKTWLLQGNYTAVWMLDSKDIFFQGDPFAEPFQDFKLFSDKPMALSLIPKQDMAVCDKDFLKPVGFGKRPNLCGGTIGGKREHVLEFLDGMVEKVDTKRELGKGTCSIFDQYLINIWAYEHDTSYYDFGDGPAINLQNQCRQLEKMTNNETGKIENKQGAPFAIVHKWNLCGRSVEMARNLASTLGVDLPELPELAHRRSVEVARNLASTLGVDLPELT